MFKLRKPRKNRWRYCRGKFLPIVGEKTSLWQFVETLKWKTFSDLSLWRKSLRMLTDNILEGSCPGAPAWLGGSGGWAASCLPAPSAPASPWTVPSRVGHVGPPGPPVAQLGPGGWWPGASCALSHSQGKREHRGERWKEPAECNFITLLCFLHGGEAGREMGITRPRSDLQLWGRIGEGEVWETVGKN